MIATPQEAAREQAYNEGRDNPGRAWVLTFFDTWERNPFYAGPPVPHPESYYDSDDAEPTAATTAPSPDVEIPF